MIRLRVLLAVLAVFLVGEAHAQTERITDFLSAIVVRENGDLFVTETISVVAAGDAIKRGIYRDFPTLYQTKMGLRRSVAFEVIEVLRDGVAEPWRMEGQSNGERIYFGQADYILPPGPYTYTLKYRTNRQLVLTENFDELYWNVTGNGWAFPIDHATARVTLPGGAKALSAEAYTGPDGTKGTDWRVRPTPDGTVEIETTAPLAAEEGFTISVTWPKGFVAADANPDDLLTLAKDNPLFILSLLGLVLVFVYYVVAWWLIGRDPPRGVIIPQYEPPPGFTPSAVRFVAGLGRFDTKSFAAAVLNFAVIGALRIRREADEFTLTRTGNSPQMAPGQRKFFDKLFGEGGELPLVQRNHQTLQAANQALGKWLRNDFEKAYFARNFWIWLGGLLLSLVPAGLAILSSADFAVAAFMGVWLAIWSMGVTALLSSVITGFRSGRILSTIPLALFSIPFVIGWIVGVLVLFFATSLISVMIFVVGVGLNFAFYHLLKAPTIQGRAVLDHIEGFRHYLGVAESERLNLQNPPDRTPELFEKFLPYALALDVEQRWAEQFSDVLAAASYQPDWFVGSDFARVGAMGLTSSLGGAMTSAIASSSTSPGSSSGSGGGGSSGGGGGGGGGGGW